MGWGYFLDARLHLPATAWAELSEKKTSDFATPVGWWGMKDKELERRFVDMFGDVSKGWTFGKLVKHFAGKESIGVVTPDEDGAVAVRIVRLLSKDMDTDVARGVAAMFEAAKAYPADGHVSLANDGTYVGENGVTVTLAKGKLTRKAIKDGWAYTEHLAMELFGEDIFEDLEEEMPKKAAKASKKVAKASKPAAKASKKVAKASKPAAKASKKVAKASKPAAKAPKKVAKASKKVAKASKPAAKAPKKVAKASKKVAKKR
jgi:adenylate kinase